MRYKAIALCVVAVLLVVPAVCSGQIVTQKWFFNDGPCPSYQWGDSDPILGGPYWEWMDSLAIGPADSLCGIADVLNPPQEFYATSQVASNETWWCHFWAEIYLSNNYANHNNPVHAALGYGTPGNTASFVQVAPTVTVNVTNLTPGCGIPYIFDFAIPASFTLVNQALMVKIWIDVPPGDVHIYWDSPCCPSALYADCTVPVEEKTWGTIKELYRH